MSTMAEAMNWLIMLPLLHHAAAHWPNDPHFDSSLSKSAWLLPTLDIPFWQRWRGKFTVLLSLNNVLNPLKSSRVFAFYWSLLSSFPHLFLTCFVKWILFRQLLHFSQKHFAFISRVLLQLSLFLHTVSCLQFRCHLTLIVAIFSGQFVP